MLTRKPVWEEIEEWLRLLIKHEISICEAKDEILKTLLYITEEERETLKDRFVNENPCWEIDYKKRNERRVK